MAKQKSLISVIEEQFKEKHKIIEGRYQKEVERIKEELREAQRRIDELNQRKEVKIKTEETPLISGQEGGYFNITDFIGFFTGEASYKNIFTLAGFLKKEMKDDVHIMGQGSQTRYFLPRSLLLKAYDKLEERYNNKKYFVSRTHEYLTQEIEKSSSKLPINTFLRLVFKDGFTLPFYISRGRHLETVGFAGSSGQGEGKHRFIFSQNIDAAYTALKQEFNNPEQFGELTTSEIRESLENLGFQVLPQTEKPQGEPGSFAKTRKPRQSRLQQKPPGRTIPLSEFYKFFLKDHEDRPARFKKSTLTHFVFQNYDLFPVGNGMPGRAILENEVVKAYEDIKRNYKQPWIKRLTVPQLERKIKQYFDSYESLNQSVPLAEFRKWFLEQMELNPQESRRFEINLFYYLKNIS